MTAQTARYDDHLCEVYYPDDYDPDGELEMTIWPCLACWERELDRGLYHNKAGLVCIECGERYADEDALARAQTALFTKLYERIGELEDDKNRTEKQLMIVEAKLAEVKRAAA